MWNWYYSIYLCHVPVLFVVAYLIAMASPTQWRFLLPFVVGGVVGTGLISICTYAVVEMPGIAAGTVLASAFRKKPASLH